MLGIELKEVLTYLVSKYKECQEKNMSGLGILMAIAFTKACEKEVKGYNLRYFESGDSLISFMAKLIRNLGINTYINVSSIDREAFISKLNEEHIIEVETIHGSTDKYDLNSYYNSLYNNFLTIFRECTLENKYAEKRAGFEGQEDISKNIQMLTDKVTAVIDMYDEKKEDQLIKQPIMALVRCWAKGTEQVFEGCERKYILDFIDCFENRRCKDNITWSDIADKVSEFANTLSCNEEYCIDISAHYSIAYYLGLLLNSKSGKKAYINQRSVGGINSWKSWAEESDNMYKLLDVETIELDMESNNIAICISATMLIHNDVKEYIEANGIRVKKIINFSFGDYSGNSSVANGEHAWKLAQQVKSVLNSRNISERNGQLHLFFAAPVSVVFFLGQISFPFRNINLYEFTGVYDPKEIYYRTLFIEKGEI